MEIVDLGSTPLELTVRRAAKELKAGSIIVYPTDTVYGFGVDALNSDAILHLREFKGRERKKPILVIVPHVASIEKYAVLNRTARILANTFLPGPLTLVLPAKNTIPAELTLNGTIGIRIPDNEFCLALAKEFGRPFTTTSANKSGRETPASLEEIIAQFGQAAKEIKLAVHVDPVSEGLIRRAPSKPSTIVSCVTEIPYLLREGAISREDLGLHEWQV